MVVFPLVTLLVCVAALLWQMHTANQTLASVRSADERIRQTVEIQKLIIDEETGLRGYQITRDPIFLQPYYLAKARLPQAFQTAQRSGP